MTTVTVQQVREWFGRNWVFRLFRLAHPLLIVVGIPAAVFAVGGVAALLFGRLDLFARNLLAYPFGISFGLAAYGWFANYFPQTLAEISTAFECAPGQVEQIGRKWAQRLANRNVLMVIAGAAIGASMLPNLLGLWAAPDRPWLGQGWVQSDVQRGFPFFALYYGFNDVAAGGFLFGSGAVGLLGTVLLVNELLHLPLKLAYTRKLMAICNLGLWLAVWTMVGFIFILPVKVLSTTQILHTRDLGSIALTTLVLAFIDAAALALAFGVPIMAVRAAIMRTKARQLESLLTMQESIYDTMEHLLQEGGAAGADAAAPTPYVLHTQLKTLLTERYNMEELRTLCFDLGVDYENVQRDTKEATAREMILYFERHCRAHDLLRTAAGERNLDVGQLPQPSPQEQLAAANEELELTQKLIKDIEAIPSWPVTTQRIVQASVFFSLATLSGVGSTYVTNALSGAK